MSFIIHEANDWWVDYACSLCLFVFLIQNFQTIRKIGESSKRHWKTWLCSLDCGNTIMSRQWPVLPPTLWIRGLEMGGEQLAKLQVAVIWGEDSHEGCKAIWEARRCSKFCESLQQQADILHSLLLWQKYTGLSARRTWPLLICSQRNISSYIHNYSPSEDSTMCPVCPTGRLAGFLSASLLKMLYGLTFHVALPMTPLS